MFESFWVKYEDPNCLDEALMKRRGSDIHTPIRDRKKINIKLDGIEYDFGRSIRSFKGSGMPIKL